MAVETHPPHSQQGAVIDFKPDAHSCVARFFTRDSDIRIRMAQLIQSSANRDGSPMKRRWIGWFAERRREVFVFQHFLGLVFREEAGARVFPFGKERQLVQMGYSNSSD